MFGIMVRNFFFAELILFFKNEFLGIKMKILRRNAQNSICVKEPNTENQVFQRKCVQNNLTCTKSNKRIVVDNYDLYSVII